MAVSNRTDLAFLDETSVSNYVCDTCHTLPKRTLRAQCCGAIYCQKCAEVAESGAVLSAKQRPKNPAGVRMNLKKIVCVKCKRGNLQLLLDDVIQEKVDKLQVQCLKPGCGWTGDFAISTSHLNQPHVEEEIYDNEVVTHEEEEMVYEDTIPQQDEEYYEDTLAQPEPEQDIYDNQIEPQQDEMYEDTLAQSAQDIYDNETQNEEDDELYVDPLAGEDIVHDNNTPAQQDYETYDYDAMAQAEKNGKTESIIGCSISLIISSLHRSGSSIN